MVASPQYGEVLIPVTDETIVRTDISAGEKRYILCSLQVEEAVIEQLNTAIRQYVVLPQE